MFETVLVVEKESPGLIIRRIRLQDPRRSQEEFAAELGVSRGSVAAWETDVSIPEGKNLAKLLLVATREHAEALLKAMG